MRSGWCGRMAGMAVRKVIIAGGGVAGAVAALALLKVGIEAEVYEAHPSGARMPARSSP